MIIDIIIIITILLYALAGSFKGFAFTFIHTIGWLMAIVLSFMATPYTENYLLKNTNLAKSIPVINLKGLKMPEILNIDLETLTQNTLITIVIFIFLVFAIRFILALFLHMYTRSIKGGAIGALDAFLGFLLGLLKGGLIVLILLFAVYPISYYLYPDTISLISKQLETSYISNLLYSYNPIYLLINLFVK